MIPAFAGTALPLRKQGYSDYAHGSKRSAVIMTSLGVPKPRIYKSHNMVPQELVWQYGPEDCNPYITEWQVLLDAIRQDRPRNPRFCGDRLAPARAGARRAGEANVAALMGRMAGYYTGSGGEFTLSPTATSDPIPGNPGP